MGYFRVVAFAFLLFVFDLYYYSNMSFSLLVVPSFGFILAFLDGDSGLTSCMRGRDLIMYYGFGLLDDEIELSALVRYLILA